MTLLKSNYGKWGVTNEGKGKYTISGEPDTSGLAYAYRGSETATDYTHRAKVTVPADSKAGLIVAHTTDEDWQESYIAAYLDEAEQKIGLYAVKRTETGALTSIESLTERTFEVVAGTEYDLALILEKDADNYGNVYLDVDGVRVLEAEGLLELFSAGQFGFEVTAGSAVFTYMLLPSTAGYANIEAVKKLCNLATPDQDAVLEEINVSISRSVIDTTLTPYITTLPLTTVPNAIVEIANSLVAGKYLQDTAPDEKQHPYTVAGAKNLEVFVDAYRLAQSTVRYG